jgi:cell division protein FtsB
MPTPKATAYETDIKTLRKRVNYLRAENEVLHEEIDRLN